MQKKSFFKLFLSFILICILFSSCTHYKTLKLEYIETKTNTPQELKTPSNDVISIKKTDFAQLLFDKKTFTVNVKDLQTDHEWQTLAGQSSENSGAIALSLYTKHGVYLLNTQDHSVNFGTASFSEKDGVLTVSYVLSDNAETAKKDYTDITQKDAYVKISITYTLKEQSLNVSVNTANALCTPGGFIGEIDIMPYFGAAQTDAKEDYFMLPDASGAIMNLSIPDEATDNVSVSIYGNDPYSGNLSSVASATVPAFGVKRQDSAFAAIITQGDSLCTINASRKTTDTSSKISPSFKITTTSTPDENNSITYGSQYSGRINIVYKFLAQSNADYISMATAAREEFIANGTMSSLKQNTDGEIPFNITLIAKSNSLQLTTTDQAVDILGILKGKGINNINLIYKGFFSGGYANKSIYSEKTDTRSGGTDGLKSLHDYTTNQGCKLILDINIFSSVTAPSLEKITTLTGTNANYSMNNALSFSDSGTRLITRIGTKASDLGKQQANPEIYDATENFTMYLRSAVSLQDKFPSFLESDIIKNVDGISLYDAGSVLCSDKNTNREEAKRIISECAKTVSNYGDLVVDTGNIYTVYGADLITNMKFSTFYKESDAYTPIPFTQAVLHGYTSYTSEPIDAGDPLYRYDMLQCIEYGALPSYLWTYENKNIFCYSGYMLPERVKEISEFYIEASAIFSDLTDDTITGHKAILTDADGNAISGVYCTSYSDGTDIYVNYTGTIVSTPGNIAIGPYDFVAVKG